MTFMPVRVVILKIDFKITEKKKYFHEAIPTSKTYLLLRLPYQN